MTLGPQICYTMKAVLKNVEIKGSTMGSRKEFKEMIAFVEANKLQPVISQVINGLEDINAIDGLFETMKRGSQFGKLVVSLKKSPYTSRI